MVMSAWDWSTTAGSNNASPPYGAPENMAPSAVDDTMRQMMALVSEPIHSQVAGGTADALTVTLIAVPAALTDGMVIHVRAASANATTTPTLNVNSLGAKTITKNGGSALVAGDIGGNLYECVFIYNLANTRWELQNPKASSGFTGGTLSTLTAMSAAAFNEAFTTLASASTVNIGAAAANYIQITGTTTITAFDTIQAGTERTLEFAGILTLTHNATTLILPNNGSNITTAAGDVATFRSEGSGNWRCTNYQTQSSSTTTTVANGGTGRTTLTNHGLLVGAGAAAITQLADATNGQIPIGSTGVDPVLATITAGAGIAVTNAAGSITVASDSFVTEASIASAATCDIGSLASNVVTITGTTTITSLGSSANANNPIYIIRFQGAITLTYNATSLIIPGATSITAASGDTAMAKYEGSGNWRVFYYKPAANRPVSPLAAGTYGSTDGSVAIGQLIVNSEGRITGLHTITGLTGSGGSGGGGFTCYLAGTIVWMADGRFLPIEAVRIGDRVRGAFGEINTVIALDRPLLAHRPIWMLNGEHGTTAEHPHLTMSGFAALNPDLLRQEWGESHRVITARGMEHWVNPGLPVEMIVQMSMGQELRHFGGWKPLSSIGRRDMDPATQLYNLVLDGSHTYYVDGYVSTGWPRLDDFDYAVWKPRLLRAA